MSIKQYYEVIRKSRSNDELISLSGIQLPNPRGSLSDKIPTDAINPFVARTTIWRFGRITNRGSNLLIV